MSMSNWTASEAVLLFSSVRFWGWNWMGSPSIELRRLETGNRSPLGSSATMMTGLSEELSRFRPVNEASGAETYRSYDPSAEVMDFDIALHSQGPVRLKTDEVDVEATGDIRLTGTNERFGLLVVSFVEFVITGGTVFWAIDIR